MVWKGGLQDGSGYGIFGQRFDPSGSRAGSEFQVNSYTTLDPYSPEVAGVFAQRFDAAGGRVAGEFQVNSATASSQVRPAVAVGAAGTFVAAWFSDQGQDGMSGGVFGQRLAAVPFSGGFEAGDACAWSATVGGGNCP